METSDLSDSDLLAKLRTALAGDAEDVPENHRTSAGWANHWGVTHDMAKRLIRAGRTKGLLAEKRYRVLNAIGVAAPTPHYYELEAQKK